jgi:hypothetical protein
LKIKRLQWFGDLKSVDRKGIQRRTLQLIFKGKRHMGRPRKIVLIVIRKHKNKGNSWKRMVKEELW